MLFSEQFKRVDNSRPPLRWIANWFGNIGSWAILKAVFAQEDARHFSSFIYSKIFDLTFPIYEKYGTVYQTIEEEDEYL